MRALLVYTVLFLLPHLVCCLVKYYTHGDAKYIVDDASKVDAPGAQGFFKRGIRRIAGKSDEIVWIKYARMSNTIKGMNPVNVEKRCYDIIKEDTDTRLHFAQIYADGIDKNLNARYMIMQHLGDNLATVFEKCNKKFSHSTIVELLREMLDFLEFCIRKGFVYNDIRPENFLFGMPGTANKNKLYLTDFGLSHSLMEKNEMLNGLRSGTLDFITSYAYEFLVHSLAQDLGSLGYVAIYLLNEGILPWSNKNKIMLSESKSIADTIKDVKQFVKDEKKKLNAKTITEILKEHPPPFAEFVIYALEERFSNDISILTKARSFLERIPIDTSAKFEWESLNHTSVSLPKTLNMYWRKEKELPQAYFEIE